MHINLSFQCSSGNHLTKIWSQAHLISSGALYVLKLESKIQKLDSESLLISILSTLLFLFKVLTKPQVNMLLNMFHLSTLSQAPQTV